MFKQLHLGNIANVAYGYCKLLREAGQDCSVLCYDLQHAISQPEWLDGDFDTSELDLDNFDASSPKYQQFSPPDWFSRIKSEDYFLKERPRESFSVLDEDWMNTLIHFSRRYGKRWTLSERDIESFRPLSEGLAKHFMVNYDVIFGYAYAAIPPFLWGMKPYVPVEIGTLRNIPFDDSALGRLLALAYRTAPQVIITNPDVIGSIKELGIENYTFVPHPLDEDIWKPSDADERLNLRREYQAEFILFAPARQDWTIKGNHKYLRAFAGIIKSSLNAKLIIAKWGKDIDRSKALIRKLGIQDFVVWINPLPERTLIKFFNSADLVLDQFGSCRTFGLITPKALSCGTPVLISFRPEVHEWCFGQPPPVVQANTEKEIFDALMHYLSNTEQRTDLSEQSRTWVLQHHSKRIITDKIASVLESVCGDSEPGISAFHSLKQKRMELKYEAASAPAYDEMYHKSAVYGSMDDKLVSILKEHLDSLGIERPRILDLGCGPGSLTNQLLSIPGIRLTGADLSPAMIDLAKEKYPDVDFLVDDIEALSFDDNVFDVVFCSGVLHHLPRLDMGLKEIRRVLKPGGILVAREPNVDNFADRFPELAFAHLCLRHYLAYAMGVCPTDEPDAHEYHRSFHLGELADEVGRYFRVIDFRTDLMVSYFYDMVPERDCIATEALGAVESTLVGHPGLNIIVVATKGYSTGIDDAVKEGISQIDEKKDIDPNHFLKLYEYSEWLFKTYEGRFYEKVAASNSPDLGRNFWKGLKDEQILVSCSDSDESAAMAEHYRLLMFGNRRARKSILKILRIGWRLSKPLLGWLVRTPPRWKRTGGRKKIPHLYSRAIGSPEMYSQKYDIGFFFITEDISAEALIETMDAVRDHGIIYLQINRGVKIGGIDDKHRTYFDQMAVLNRLESSGGDWRSLFMSKHVYTQKDFYRALAVAINKVKEKTEGNIPASIDNVLAKANSKMNALRGKFGSLEMMLKSKASIMYLLEPQNVSPKDA